MSSSAGTSKNANEMLYTEVTAQHAGIDDLRGKLLGFLPGIAGLTLFFGSDRFHLSDIPPQFMLAIGVLGAVTTFGLLMHELRGVVECYMLYAVGSELEHRLTEQNKRTAPGPISIKYDMGLNPLVGRETAAVAVYSATISAWTYIAFTATSAPKSQFEAKYSWDWSTIAPAVVVFILVVLLSEWRLFAWKHKIMLYRKNNFPEILTQTPN